LQVCNKLFTISHGRIIDIKKHASGTQHQQLHNQVGQNHLLSIFITISRNGNADQVMAAELTQIHPTV
jgi:hypothetical protein